MNSIKFFELSKKKNKNGRRAIKVILHEIHDSDDQCNLNGITWKQEYVEKNLDSIVGASITCEFTNDERTDILGHGETGIEDNLPIFENASMVGVFTKASISTVNIDDVDIKVAIAEGYIDEMRYKNFVDKLESEINNGNTISGSVEIIGKPENDNKITYEDGYKPKFRKPVDFIYSGWAILSISPASPIATVLEMNEKKESEGNDVMDEKNIAQLIETIRSTIIETNSRNSDYEGKLEESNSKIVEVNATVESLQEALDAAKEELSKKYEEIDTLYRELNLLREEVAKAKVKERVGELNSALADFSDSEKEYAKEEIESFNADPLNYEVNSIVSKISVEIVKKAKESSKTHETNTKHESTTDIFSDVYETNSKDPNEDDNSIF